MDECLKEVCRKDMAEIITDKALKEPLSHFNQRLIDISKDYLSDDTKKQLSQKGYLIT